jgi:hypothetical protein
MVKHGLIFLVVVLVLAVNTPEGFLVRLGFDPNILMITLIALVITGLVAQRNLALVVLVVLLIVGANLPPETAESLGVNPDYLLATLIGLVLAPIVIRYMQ